MVQFCAVTVVYEHGSMEFSASGSGEDILAARRDALAGVLLNIRESVAEEYRYASMGEIVAAVNVHYWNDICSLCGDELDEKEYCHTCKAFRHAVTITKEDE